MELRITRIDKSLPLPEYKTPGAVAFDLLTRVETVIPPHSIVLVPGNLIVQIPVGYILLIALRSSSPIKKGLAMPHGMGLIDQDYNGPQDELKTQVYNLTEQPITVARGERISQALIMPIEIVSFKEIETAEIPTTKSRIGFGSTG